ncbi:TIGR03087 family PEP-CTERM/XrtA system glycosyltransferase [Lacisediminimonas profundi]|uniref:TIGR03087 family PEP-CTERM/XrtA system glycosyltransferase n=1 Tax=Lacisediminimonas profundi TaxID=2603856 RepID=UPI00124B5FBE|nr:TIGR03087 family PEP-CTERM/XrtA system glycosyltransferase [Lacisediminimonas profundi]
MATAHLLFLAHRVPWPPDKGDKIRSYHLLRHLAGRFTVHLGAFVDDERDWQHESALREVCGDVKLVPLGALRTRARGALGLLTGAPFTTSCYADQRMARWVADTVRTHGIDRVLVFSSSMAQYAAGLENAVRVIDFVDVDSDKWRQYADRRRWYSFARWLYRREATLLAEHERSTARSFDASLFVSAAEARLFASVAPESIGRIGWFNNGVDADYFSPWLPFSNPYPSGERAIAFTGAMNYWPNVDAVRWFATEVLPAIREQEPDVVFTIVGSRPAKEVSMLARLPGVRVTGAVPDVRPWLVHAVAAVAPLRMARGVQNKVLEAMAMGKPVVTSPEALEGIDATDGDELIVAAGATAFSDAVLALLRQGALEQRVRLGQRARARILERYGWEPNLARVELALDAGRQAQEPALLSLLASNPREHFHELR